MKKTIILVNLLVFLLFINCNKIKLDIQVSDSTKNENIETITSEMDITIYPQEIKNHIGTFCITNIIENNVNVRIFPSLEAEIINILQKNDIVEIRGFSNETSTFNNQTRNWVSVLYKDKNNKYIYGWVFSSFVNLPDIEPTLLEFREIINDNRISRIKISYSLKDKEIFKESWFTDCYKYYVIIWGPYEQDYHYSCIPGTYILDKETLELKHITYLGALDVNTGGMNDWTRFTDDFMYLIQDVGTGNHPRGITAWSVHDMKNVFNGLYYYDCNIIDHTINVIYRDFPDQELALFAKQYKENNPIPQHMIEKQLEGLHIELLVKCIINLDTGERIINDAIYVLTE